MEPRPILDASMPARYTRGDSPGVPAGSFRERGVLCAKLPALLLFDRWSRLWITQVYRW